MTTNPTTDESVPTDSEAEAVWAFFVSIVRYVMGTIVILAIVLVFHHHRIVRTAIVTSHDYADCHNTTVKSNGINIQGPQVCSISTNYFVDTCKNTKAEVTIPPSVLKSSLSAEEVKQLRGAYNPYGTLRNAKDNVHLGFYFSNGVTNKVPKGYSEYVVSYRPGWFGKANTAIKVTHFNQLVQLADC